jgi:hypothetical protein
MKKRKLYTHLLKLFQLFLVISVFPNLLLRTSFFLLCKNYHQIKLCQDDQLQN